jgi:hypothetical protein
VSAWARLAGVAVVLVLAACADAAAQERVNGKSRKLQVIPEVPSDCEDDDAQWERLSRNLKVEYIWSGGREALGTTDQRGRGSFTVPGSVTAPGGAAPIGSPSRVGMTLERCPDGDGLRFYAGGMEKPFFLDTDCENRCAWLHLPVPSYEDINNWEKLWRAELARGEEHLAQVARTQYEKALKKRADYELCLEKCRMPEAFLPPRPPCQVRAKQEVDWPAGSELRVSVDVPAGQVRPRATRPAGAWYLPGEPEPEASPCARDAAVQDEIAVREDDGETSPPLRPWTRLLELLRPPRPFVLAAHALSAPRPAAPSPRPAGQGPLAVLLTSLGGSTGPVFELQASDPAAVPPAGASFVIEPLRKEAQEKARKGFQAQAGKAPARIRLNAYCLEFLKPPPLAGTVYRVAGADAQARYEPMHRIVAATRRMQREGALRPDVDPRRYVHDIRQWALWTRDRGFSQEAFGREFVEHTRKAILAAGRPWTREVRAAVEQAVPGRWTEIQRILAAADAEPPPGPPAH